LAALLAGCRSAGGAPAAMAAGDAGAEANVSLKAVPVATGLDQPTSFTFTPSGKIWYIDKPTGQVRVLNPSTGADHLFVDITGVDGSGERGGLGIALHPRWAAKPCVYVYVTRMDNGRVRNELIRYRDAGGHSAGKRTVFRWA